jgi:hypothetical protein
MPPLNRMLPKGPIPQEQLEQIVLELTLMGIKLIDNEGQVLYSLASPHPYSAEPTLEEPIEPPYKAVAMSRYVAEPNLDRRQERWQR